jgi:dephospho-CoA kinase
VIGLIGGIGSGKSRIAAALAQRGARIISGDELGHQALRQAAIRERIVQRFGAAVLDEHGEIQRRRLGAIVFRDRAELRALEELVHPWIESRIEEEVEAARADPSVRLIVLDAAILLEAGWDHVCDRIVFVDVPFEERWNRLHRQRGWTMDELRTREAAQLPLTEKRARADDVMDNSASPEQLERQLDALLESWAPGQVAHQAT